jgi:hypothetical protein
LSIAVRAQALGALFGIFPPNGVFVDRDLAHAGILINAND